MFQGLWKIKNLKWDDELHCSITEQWKQYQNELASIENISVPRCLIREKVISRQLHGFSDASMKAYFACIYLKCIREDGSVEVNLVASKTGVALDKIVSLSISIPSEFDTSCGERL